MLIIEQNRDPVTNIGHFVAIEKRGSSICSYRWNDRDALVENEMASYETPERAQEVFEDFLGAVLRKNKVFELPEE